MKENKMKVFRSTDFVSKTLGSNKIIYCWWLTKYTKDTFVYFVSNDSLQPHTANNLLFLKLFFRTTVCHLFHKGTVNYNYDTYAQLVPHYLIF